MADFATRADVEAAWRPLTTAELAIIDSRLGFISAIIRSQVRAVDSRIAAGTLDAELVKHIAVEAVLRNLRNPDGKAEEQIEDYRYKRDPALSAGSLYLTDAELDLLGQKRGAFSITPGQEPADAGITERVAVLQRNWRYWPTVPRDGTDTYVVDV